MTAWTMGTALKNIPQGDKLRGNTDGGKAPDRRSLVPASAFGGSAGAPGAAGATSGEAADGAISGTAAAGGGPAAEEA